MDSVLWFISDTLCDCVSHLLYCPLLCNSTWSEALVCPSLPREHFGCNEQKPIHAGWNDSEFHWPLWKFTLRMSFMVSNLETKIPFPCEYFDFTLCWFHSQASLKMVVAVSDLMPLCNSVQKAERVSSWRSFRRVSKSCSRNLGQLLLMSDWPYWIVCSFLNQSDKRCRITLIGPSLRLLVGVGYSVLRLTYFACTCVCICYVCVHRCA